MHETLATLLRPKNFSDVIGQEHAVRFLSGLAQRGRIGRNILLHGTVGSGKTTLARIYGHALVCEGQLLEDGSPCGVCARCKDIKAGARESGFHEYDVAGEGGDADKLDKWFWEREHYAAGLPNRVYFFDEAHAMSKEASDWLLKRVESANEELVFIFATSEHHNLSDALRSRLVPLKVRALSQGQAIALLRKAAASRGLSYDDDALALITVMVARQPRDLLNALDQIAGYRAHISVDTLRDTFDFEYLDALGPYLVALGQQDHRKLNLIVDNWRDSAEEKQRWVLALLGGIYATDILGIAADVDPVVRYLRTERRHVLDDLRERLSVTTDFELAPYWRQLMGHWRSELVGADEAAIAAQFVSFHNLVLELSPFGTLAEDTRLTDSRPLVGEEAAGGEGFFGAGDAQTLVELASSLVQEHGLHINAKLSVSPATDVADWSEQANLANDICSALQEELRGHGSEQFAAVWTVEGSRSGIIARVGLCVPEIVGPNAHDGLHLLRLWRVRWSKEHPETDIRLETILPRKERDAFHWGVVRDMLDALPPDIEVTDRDLNLTPLRTLLGLKQRPFRDPSIAPLPLVRSSGLLDRATLRPVQESGSALLSAFADRAWDMVFAGWEIKEHEDRQREVRRREQQLLDLVIQYEDLGERERQSELLRQTWPSDPHAMRRSWTPWWTN